MTDRWELVSKIVVAFVVLCITFLIPVMVQLYFFNSRNQRTVNENGAEQLTLFRIDSRPPQSVLSGSDFAYQVVWKYNGAEKVSLIVDEKPEWLTWNEADDTFKGIVPQGINFFKIKVIAKAGALTDVQDVSVEIKMPEETAPPAPSVSATTSVTPSITQSISPTVTPTEITEITPTLQQVAGFINPEDPFHPIIQETPTTFVAETDSTSAAVLGAKTSDFVALAPVERNYVPIVGGVIVVVLVAITGVILYPRRHSENETIKTHSGLVIHTAHGKNS